MNATSTRLICLGLVLGAVLGLAGSFVPQPGLRGLFWTIDGAGAVMATILLALRHHAAQQSVVAAGFLVYAIGEAVIMAGSTGDPSAGLPAFAAGSALWATGLLLVSLPGQLALWVRAAGTVAGLLFVIVAARIALGEALTPTTAPLPFFAYPFLVLTFIGWIWTVLRAAD